MRMYVAIWIAINLSSPSQADGCENIDFEGHSYSVCIADPSNETIRTSLNGGDGSLLGNFSKLQTELGQEPLWAMNAGMYHADRAPVGLYIEDGQELAPIVTRDGPGNFGLLPNGVLCIGEGVVSVIESRQFQSEGRQCKFASQSGPMLVIDGRLHQRFLPESDSLFRRNGVGVTTDGLLVGAISNQPVNFHSFARLFRDVLKTPNALYFDGKVSELFAPELGRRDSGLPMGPILSVTP